MNHRRPLDPSPGWHPDPWQVASLRYWDGSAWTGWTHPSHLPDPISPPSAPAAPEASEESLLAFDAPGASARAKAEELRAEAPVKSVLARMLGVRRDDENWRRGAVGEERVAKRLAKLPSPPWTVLHDLPIGATGANIDHLVIGPGGVYTLNTKNLTGKVWVAGGTFKQNGQNRPYVSAASREAKQVTRRLKLASGVEVPAMGLVVVTADEVTVKRQPDDVRVLTRRQVTRWIAARPVRLDAQTTAVLAQSARKPGTWM